MRTDFLIVSFERNENNQAFKFFEFFGEVVMVQTVQPFRKNESIIGSRVKCD